MKNQNPAIRIESQTDYLIFRYETYSYKKKANSRARSNTLSEEILNPDNQPIQLHYK